jgi:hypothetical protein
MKYNTAKDELVIPEYGRHIQNLIKYCKKVENKDERQALAEKIVDLMMQMHPQNRNMDDYRDKLWKHFFRIANYDIDVDTPAGVHPSRDDDDKRPERIAYPVVEAKFRHYGHNVQQLIKRALEMEEGPIRDGFVAVIGSYMKLAYKTWNKEYYVSDDIIKTDLENLSNGQLSLDENAAIDSLSGGRRRAKSSNGKSSGSSHQGGKSRNKGRKRK